MQYGSGVVRPPLMTTVPLWPASRERASVTLLAPTVNGPYDCPHVTPGSFAPPEKLYGEIAQRELPPSIITVDPAGKDDHPMLDGDVHAFAQLVPFVLFPDG